MIDSSRYVPMIPYLDLSGNSGVKRYGFHKLTPANQVMVIEFKDGSTYAFISSLVGQSTFDKMKELADNGQGLATYLSKNRLRGLKLEGDQRHDDDDDGSGG